MKKHKIFVALVFSFGSLLNVGSVFALTANDSTLFTVSIPEEIIVTVNVPQIQDNDGTVGNFLRNKVSIEVGTNNRYGLSTILKTKTNITALTNTFDRSYSIPTLSASTVQSSFPTNYWGFSEDDSSSVSGTSTYYPLSVGGTNLSSVSSSSAAILDADIYFGMKADGSKVSGTYTNTVVVAVVGKTSGGGTEVDPTPVDDDDNPEVIADETDGDTHTIITETDNTNGTTTREKTVETEDNNGNMTEKTVSSYETPQGMTETTTSSGVNVSAVILGAVALVSSTGLFLMAVRIFRRNKDEDDEEY